jgi:hypothetical protein
MKRSLLIIVVLFSVLVLAAALAIYFWEVTSYPLRVESSSPKYLFYSGGNSRIYLLSAVTSYGVVNEAYVTPAGQVVQKGDPLFIMTITLRNDYTSDNPPPPLPNQDQTSPADGTAYLYLTAQLYDKNGSFNATNVSISDFSLPATTGAGFVLASGEIRSINIYMLTSRLDSVKCDVNLVILGDSIPV